MIGLPGDDALQLAAGDERAGERDGADDRAQDHEDRGRDGQLGALPLTMRM